MKTQRKTEKGDGRSLNLMVIGGGGREHALIKKLKENPQVETVYALPGNGGIACDAQCVPIAATDIDQIVAFAKTHCIDFAVVAPDDPLVMGCVDALEAIGVPAFGPTADAAIIEGSKAFAKAFMRLYGIPTAPYAAFSDEKAALSYVRSAKAPLVVKADGLALGKGVVICQTIEEAEAAVHSMMSEHRFGKSGESVVIEKFLQGPEVSVLSFTDGETVVPMVAAMDYKRALEGDSGLNTGGMGCIAPNPFYTPDVAQRCMSEIFLPTVWAMRREGRRFRGCLYFGLMITEDGPKVIEYNCRFGDPETQVVLPLLQTDLLTVMQACVNGTLKDIRVSFSDESAACVILASGSYPQSYRKGFVISGLEEAEKIPGVTVYHAGTAQKDGKLVTNGGRVLGVTATAQNLSEALQKAYSAAEQITFQDCFYRRDIGMRALQATER